MTTDTSLNARLCTGEARKRYQIRRQDDLEACRRSLDAADFAAIERVGHTLKGSGATFGYPEISLLGARLERAARRKDVAQVSRRIEALAAWVAERSQ